jgi:O-antigen/teichoic acid export membrane protein
VLSVGIAMTGVVTFAYFSVASYALSELEYKRVALLWAVMFVIVSVIYRPIEQLLSRTIAERRARGLHHGHPLGIPLLIQGTFALVFLVVALLLRGSVQDQVFDGSAALYWILVGGVLAYAASYFARGWLAGHQRFGLYGGLVLLESCSRFLFALAAVVGLTSGQAAVALGMAAAPCVSLFVVPWAFSRHEPSADVDAVARAEGGLTLRHGASFAVSVLAVMLAEQTLVNGAVLTVDAVATDAALAGVVFSVLLIARAPLQLFQAIQTTILPHLTRLTATGETDPFSRSVIVTLRAIALFAVAVALGMLVLGPFAMHVIFGGHYGRLGLVAVSVGMGFYLSAATLNQAALARGWTTNASARWVVAAAAFVVFLVIPMGMSKVTQVELGYLLASALLCGLLYELYRRPT